MLSLNLKFFLIVFHFRLKLFPFYHLVLKTLNFLFTEEMEIITMIFSEIQLYYCFCVFRNVRLIYAHSISRLNHDQILSSTSYLSTNNVQRMQFMTKLELFRISRFSFLLNILERTFRKWSKTDRTISANDCKMICVIKDS